MRFSNLLPALVASVLAQDYPSSDNMTYYNPVLPGWHSDPSCTRVNDTFYCVTSTFEVFPGLPIYASKDLRNWKLISHAWNRESQLAGFSWNTTGQQGGMFAATLRHHAGKFWVICEYLNIVDAGIIGTLFTTDNPYDDTAWSDPLITRPSSIDLDLFWDDDDTLYVATAGITLQKLDLETGELSLPPVSIWNGTGGVYPEGPHLYRKDGYYYLLIAEGGTELNHSVTIARSRDIYGPYESYENNPILTNRGTQEYFQTVGHADLFQDEAGNWWGMSLATRSGPAWEIYPMGREAVLFPVTWKEGEWPVLQRVEGKMSGWPSMPAPTRDVPGIGSFNSDPDIYDFEKGSKIPNNLVYWRVPRDGAFEITDRGLQIIPSRNNLTGIPLGDIELSGQRGLAFIGRRQTHTIFTYSVDLVSKPRRHGEEAGVTVFLTQLNHIDLGVVYLEESNSTEGHLAFRFQVESQNVPVAVPETNVIPVPVQWKNSSLRLEISAPNNATYELFAMPADDPEAAIKIGTASAALVSGGYGTFVGSLIGAYATCNGAGADTDCPGVDATVFKRWRYTGNGQESAGHTVISEDSITS